MTPTTQNRPDRLIVRHPRKFESFAEERADRKLRLAAALRVFGRYGFERGVAGHITARDPEYPDRFWINPYGMPFQHIRVSDLLCVDHDGSLVAGDGLVNTAGFEIHSAVHKARPEVVAAAHSHTRYGSTWCAMGKPLEPITVESCFFYNDHVVHRNWTGVSTKENIATDIAKNLGGKRAALLKNHGMLTVGESIDEAAFWFIALERCCEAQLLTAAAGGASPMTPEEAERTHREVGTPEIGWFSFQPDFQEILRDCPDVTD